MSASSIEKNVEQETAPKPGRKPRKPVESLAVASNTRFFVGEIDSDGKIVLSTEFPNELEARLASFRLEQVYYEVGSWKAVANMSQGGIAVERQAVMGKP